MLSNIEIQNFCSEYGIPLDFIDSKNRLPKQLKPGNYIINLQDRHEGNGTHWVALKVLDNDTGLYYDSFGISPPLEVSMRLKNVLSNRDTVQDLQSNACGFYCIAFLHFFESHTPRSFYLNTFNKMFSPDTSKNAQVLNYYIQKHIVKK